MPLLFVPLLVHYMGTQVWPWHPADSHKQSGDTLPIDWYEFENALYGYTCLQVERFAQVFADRTAYQFLVHCNADYGEVFYYLMTRPPIYRESEIRFPGYPDHPPRKPDGLAYFLQGWEDLELDPPDEDDPRLQRWIACDLSSLADFADDHAEQCQEFLRRACRVAVAVERDGKLEQLSREPSFVLVVEDHDEFEGDSWRRLVEARIELSPPWSSDTWPIAGRHPEIAAAIFLFALEYQERGELREAAHLLREALARLPELAGRAEHPVQGTDVLLPLPENTAWALAWLAKVPCHMLKPEAAEAVDKALELDPELAAGYYERANLSYGPIPPNMIELAIADLDRAIERNPNHPEYHAARAELRARPYYPFLDQATQSYGKAHQVDPFNQKWLMRRAEAYVEQGEHEAAVADFTRVFQLWHEKVSWYIRNALRGRAKCLQPLERYSEAEEDWDRLIEYEKKREYLQNRSLCRVALGDIAGATADELAAFELKD